jgi:hypothetical protein
MAFAAAILLGASWSPARGEISPGAAEFFENKIRPVLAQDCYECHRTHGKMKGGLALDYRQALLDGGDSGKVVIPGNPKDSLLLKAIRHESKDLQMPKARAKLEATVIADFEKWVRMGAPDPRDAPATDAQIATDTDWQAVMKRRKSWWSFQPIQKPDLSRLPITKGANHPVDRFLAAKLEEAHLTRAAKADRQVLIRRLSYALRGLPPSPGEITAFVGNPDEHAYEHLVDSFLASPRFGECWARHWMDWLRYADSHGSEGDPMIPYAWRYRDYLIRALNADVPYNQLVREHLCGDLMAHPRINRELGLNESALGIGHLRMVFHGYAPTDALQEQVRFTDDQINVVSKAFLGLTVSCARCHNHKFDPISQQDFYSWYGIFVSCPPAIIAVDAPDPEGPKHRADLAKRKSEIKSMLVETWLREVEEVKRKLGQPDEGWKKRMAAANDPASILHPFFLLRGTGEKSAGDMAGWWKNVKESMSQTNRNFPKRWNLADAGDFAPWRHDGPGVGEISPTGSFAIAPEGEKVLTGIYPSGVYSHLISSKDRGVLLSPRFKLDEKYDLWLRIAGDGGAVARYVVQNYPRDGSVFPVTRLGGGEWQWVKLGLDYWQGDQIHVEVTTAADQPVLADENATRSWFGLSSVTVTRSGEPGPQEVWPYAQPVLAALGHREPTQAMDLAEGFAKAVRDAVVAWRDGSMTDAQALFLDQTLKIGLLRNQLSELSELKPWVDGFRAEEASIPVPTRAQGVIETKPVDQPLFVRGDHKQPGAPVPRHFLDAMDATAYPKTESGRRQLAEDLLRPDNPLTSRVIVNRVWYHLFGRGIVATPDNFGRMGEEPSHPELLDFLAGGFVDQGYSIKRLIKFIVTSESWQMSSEAAPGALEQDPNNVLLSHFNVRRLEAEAIRDALLSVSGDLKTNEMYGPSVTGRNPRRSVYVRVKRNELDPFLAAFDAPVPASTTGKRDVTNVPGQALTLLNDPFVLELSEHWADQMKRNPGLSETARRIKAMFIRVLGRTASPHELERSEKFLQWTAAQHAQMQSERAQVEDIIELDGLRLAELRAAATECVCSRRHAAASQSTPALPKPLASWDFAEGLRDRAGSLEGHAFGKARIESGGLVLDGKSSYVASAPLTRTLKAKTLEAWVQLDDLDQQGGGIMTVQNLAGDVFDAIVIGEKNPRHWMAGSEGYARTEEFNGSPETEAKDARVQVAIVYAEDGTITCYRNGRLYGKPYQSHGPVIFEAGKSQVLFGNRHGEPVGNKCVAGKLFRARLYDYALSAREIELLAGSHPNTVSEKDLLDSMTENERQEQARWQTELAQAKDALKSLNKTPGLSSEWADLAQAMFNVKEFIYIR